MSINSNINNILKAPGRPPFIYGTAWKKENTTRLVQEALISGFTAVDTAAQPRHYREDLVGEALRNAYQGLVTRDQLFVCSFLPLQTSRVHRLVYHSLSRSSIARSANISPLLTNHRNRSKPNSRLLEVKTQITCPMTLQPTFGPK